MHFIAIGNAGFAFLYDSPSYSNTGRLGLMNCLERLHVYAPTFSYRMTSPSWIVPLCSLVSTSDSTQVHPTIEQVIS